MPMLVEPLVPKKPAGALPVVPKLPLAEIPNSMYLPPKNTSPPTDAERAEFD
jgi:hypothetical protein